MVPTNWNLKHIYYSIVPVPTDLKYQMAAIVEAIHQQSKLQIPGLIGVRLMR